MSPVGCRQQLRSIRAKHSARGLGDPPATKEESRGPPLLGLGIRGFEHILVDDLVSLQALSTRDGLLQYLSVYNDSAAPSGTPRHENQDPAPKNQTSLRFMKDSVI
ncbi:hypothetical protein JHW43_006516 [Diplocarpon mali]|nr:hypothetical protein JHW43_006516 [Diplocarpon mali]